MAGSETDDFAEPTIHLLVSRHYGFVWRVLRGLGLSRDDAEDATQQVFLVASRKIQSVEPDRARSFLYGVALRVARNARRGISRRREVPGDSNDDRQAEQPGPEQAAVLSEARALLQEILMEIPEKLRRVLVLAEIEQMQIHEIAGLEGIPEGTAASRLRLARERFKESLSRRKNPFASQP
jgi:RNA polymerase sigma-70 factor (ECF subfamily)